MSEKKQKVSNLLQIAGLVALVILTIVDLLVDEQIELIVYGTIGGLILGLSDDDIIGRFLGGKK